MVVTVANEITFVPWCSELERHHECGISGRMFGDDFAIDHGRACKDQDLPSMRDGPQKVGESGLACSHAIVAEALHVCVDRGNGHDIECTLKVRLDKIARELGRIQRDQLIALESMAHFIRYQLTITAPLPEPDLAVARTKGQERFAAFIDQVARKIAVGRSLARDVADRIAPEGEIKTEKVP